ncbi:hypothetical protein SAMN05216348_10714 [Olsenella sp. KH3B4]|nr:hypothetical protein [Olsenella sp. KH3B4]SET11923.1 hypothetical protein SAMN05216348_10714 [Olsenella sp. KH3B4]
MQEAHGLNPTFCYQIFEGAHLPHVAETYDLPDQISSYVYV